MNTPLPRLGPWRRRARAVLLLLAAFMALPHASPAQEEREPAPRSTRPQLSEKVAGEVGKLQPLLDAKNWDEAFALLRPALAHCARGSFDEAVLSGLVAQVHLLRATKADYAASIPLLERSVDLGYYEAPRQADLFFLIAQLYLQENDPVRAEDFAARYLATAPAPQADRIAFHASLLLTRAQQENPMNPDLAREALAEAERAKRLAYKPGEQVLVLEAVALQGLERFDDAAETLELLVKHFPASKQYWSQLFSIYANTNRDLRAIITLERAQAKGFMNTPRENFALVSLHYNLGNFQKAAGLLAAGLHDGTIESEPRNWELLAFAYQRMHRPEKSIEVYEDAAHRFAGGKFDAQIANLRYQMGDLPGAFDHARLALDKGEIDRPGQLGTFAAFLGYELKRYPEALAILDKVEPLVQGDRERDEYRRLRKAVEDALRPPPAPAPAPARPA